ncbi:MAG: hypothetical protein VB118_11995 [Oscillospiraceae bacterium]|nr:hypothetical protein [Oscillospiraceae bacterium]
MDKNKMYDSVGEIPDEIIADSDKHWEAQKKNKKSMWLKIGSLAACFCIIAAAAVGILLSRNNTDDPVKSDINITCTDKFQELFFGITSGATESENVPSGIWANPVTPGKFRTSITLGQELENTEDGKLFALKAEYAVSGDAKDEKAALNTAYEFFKEHGFEAGIIDDTLFLTATKAQIESICADGVKDNTSVGAEFKLANPTEEQKKLEDAIRY